MDLLPNYLTPQATWFLYELAIYSQVLKSHSLSYSFKLPLFDFRLPGVSSISADTHKVTVSLYCVLLNRFSTKSWHHLHVYVFLSVAQ